MRDRKRTRQTNGERKEGNGKEEKRDEEKEKHTDKIFSHREQNQHLGKFPLYIYSYFYKL